MGSLGYILVSVMVGAVAVVLVLGLINLMRGGSPERSQRLMQLRVLFQFAAVVVVLLVLLIASR
ncbi:MAG: twin transmembrane helix small protein [Pseudochelatococcus sp.]|jgi:NADH:ubiquinone oxidoreductase subunit 6 (subunit J)|uniref:twin transmembrane helix small protein n=1 Tax=Pseudochelatococcus sp. TaxID=2020869 RepID=UPI003D937BFF